jgi:hypothetical protein
MSIADAAHYLGCEQSHVIELIEKKNMLDAINLATPQDPIYRVDRNSLKKLKEGQVKK